jgi:hypothetical protein
MRKPEREKWRERERERERDREPAVNKMVIVFAQL